MAIRFLDLIFSLVGLLLLWPVLLIVCVFGYFDTGSPIFYQQRVGRHQRPFTLIKFRTMPMSTASVATHLVGACSVTNFGRFLRKTKIDELPQLINVLIGDMSLVGPRPCLFNQKELIDEREFRGVFDVLPGITGLAQINKVDMSTPRKLAELDKKMIEDLNVKLYLFYIFQTLLGKGSGDRVGFR
ncbi:sugar transferase [Plesiomonas shigelloides]|uniref:sugar transferase n=1 Tax=Plesiomonas shigelloides TaxID=703 RepID=UPI000579EDE8|nr:sugar transferase [Plesiomonas shigelloides]